MIINTDLPQYINDIVHYRKEAGIKQGDMAKRIGIRREHLCMIEKGKSKPSMKVLCAICDELGLKISLTKVQR